MPKKILKCPEMKTFFLGGGGGDFLKNSWNVRKKEKNLQNFVVPWEVLAWSEQLSLKTLFYLKSHCMRKAYGKKKEKGKKVKIAVVASDQLQRRYVIKRHKMALYDILRHMPYDIKCHKVCQYGYQKKRIDQTNWAMG